MAKLQITESGTDLWNLVADLPLDQIQASPEDRERLREVFFFAPLPFVRKVIFIGTPHRGSTLARRGIGRIASCVARSPADTDERHRRVVAENPGVSLGAPLDRAGVVCPTASTCSNRTIRCWSPWSRSRSPLACKCTPSLASRRRIASVDQATASFRWPRRHAARRCLAEVGRCDARRIARCGHNDERNRVHLATAVAGIRLRQRVVVVGGDIPSSPASALRRANACSQASRKRTVRP